MSTERHIILIKCLQDLEVEVHADMPLATVAVVVAEVVVVVQGVTPHQSRRGEGVTGVEVPRQSNLNGVQSARGQGVGLLTTT